MAISVTQLGNVQHSVYNNKYLKLMSLHHPVLVGSCIIISFMLNLRNYIWLIQKSLDCTVQFKSTERCLSTKLELEKQFVP